MHHLFRFKRHPLRYFFYNMSIIVGIVMIWRGIWYVLDGIDLYLFGGWHVITALGGIATGLALLYIPDRDLKEIEQL